MSGLQFYVHDLIIILSCFVNILTPLIYILLRPTKNLIHCQLLNDQDCKRVGFHTVKARYGESMCVTVLPCFKTLY